MATVTVPGTNHSTIKLSYDQVSNALLAQVVAGSIVKGLADGTVTVASNAKGSPPPLKAGVTGELVVSKSGTTFLQTGYDYVVDSATAATITGNGDAHEQVLAGSGKLTFFATSGSGSVIAGGGDDQVNIGAGDKGDWLIALGNGDNKIRAMGSGNDTITTGSGHNFIQLGSGKTFLTVGGSNTVRAGSGSETITATSRHGSDLIFGGASKLFFVADGPATVFGGSGSDTVFGGSGSDFLKGGTGGNNYLRAGTGTATLYGGGDGDRLFAAGSKAQALHAAGGNETLSGAFASGHDTFYGGSGKDLIIGGSGKNTFVAGTGTATITASPGAKNTFEFLKVMGGGSETVQGLTGASQVHIELSGYGAKEIKYALAHQKTVGGSVTITLSDNTSVTFQNVASLSSSNFMDTTKHHESDEHWDHPRDSGHRF